MSSPSSPDAGARATGPRGVALLGSTGSIGRQTLDVLERIRRHSGSSRWRPARTPACSPSRPRAFVPPRSRWPTGPRCAGLDLPAGTERVGGPDALERLATRDDVDLVVVGTGGVVSLRPVLAALRAGKVVATANKETLVAGGHLVMPLARELAAAQRRDPIRPTRCASPLAWLRPIDSEHSALWQSLVGEPMARRRRADPDRVGRAVPRLPRGDLAAVTPAQALRHPTWTMGAKITIDSATLANKGLEVIEARWLYDVGYERIDVLIHPQSLVHSLVEFVDGSLKAQLGPPTCESPSSTP